MATVSLEYNHPRDEVPKEGGNMAKMPNQLVGNAGLYFVCYQLTRRGWNVLPTSRNVKGVDIVMYDASGERMHTV